jgi:hypothetical protein
MFMCNILQIGPRFCSLASTHLYNEIDYSRLRALSLQVFEVGFMFTVDDFPMLCHHVYLPPCPKS